MTFPPLPGFLKGDRVPEPDYVLLATPYSGADALRPFALGIRSNQLVRLVTSPDNSIPSPGEANPCLISPDGKWTLVNANGYREVAVLATNRLEFGRTQTLGGIVRPTGFAFAADSSFLVYADNGWVRELSGNQWVEVGQFRLPDGRAPRAQGAAIYPDGDSIVIASATSPGGSTSNPDPSARGWNTWSKEGSLWVWRQYVPRGRDSFMTHAFHPTEGLLAESAELTVNLEWLTFWDRVGNFYVEAADIPNIQLGGGGTGVHWSPDGQYLAARGGTQRLWLWKYADRTLTPVPINTLIPPTGAVLSTAFSPDSNLLAVAHENAPFLTVISIDDMTTSKVVQDVSPGLPTTYSRIRFHPSYQPA